MPIYTSVDHAVRPLLNVLCFPASSPLKFVLVGGHTFKGKCTLNTVFTLYVVTRSANIFTLYIVARSANRVKDQWWLKQMVDRKLHSTLTLSLIYMQSWNEWAQPHWMFVFSLTIPILQTLDVSRSKHKKVQTNAYLFWQGHTVCKFSGKSPLSSYKIHKRSCQNKSAFVWTCLCLDFVSER